MNAAIVIVAAAAPAVGYFCAAASFARFVARRLAEANHVSAPHPGSDRAGGPNNGHPAPQRRQREGAAPIGGSMLAKGGNGAFHGSGTSSAAALQSSGNGSDLSPNLSVIA